MNTNPSKKLKSGGNDSNKKSAQTTHFAGVKEYITKSPPQKKSFHSLLNANIHDRNLTDIVTNTENSQAISNDI